MRPLEPGAHGDISAPRQVGPKRWQVSCRFRRLDGRMLRVVREGPNKTAAQRSLDAALYELLGKATEAKLRPHSTVNEAADLWIARVKAEQLATTHETYRRLLDRHVRPGVGQLRLREVNVPTLKGFLDGLKPTLAASTLRTIRTVLVGVMQEAIDHGAITANPVKELGRIRGGPRRAPRALTPQERTDFLSRLAADPDAVRVDLPDLALFMLGTGTRIGECIGVRWGDFALADVVTAAGPRQVPVVNISGNVVRVTGVGLVRHEGKTETAQRAIPLPRFVVEMLAIRRLPDTPDDRPVFCAGTLGYRDARNTSRSLRNARIKAGYPWVVSHVFRKTAASEWKRMGLDDRVIADLMGHAQVSMTTDVYFGRRQLHAAGADAMHAAWTGS